VLHLRKVASACFSEQKNRIYLAGEKKLKCNVFDKDEEELYEQEHGRKYRYALKRRDLNLYAASSNTRGEKAEHALL